MDIKTFNITLWERNFKPFYYFHLDKFAMWCQIYMHYFMCILPRI